MCHHFVTPVSPYYTFNADIIDRKLSRVIWTTDFGSTESSMFDGVVERVSGSLAVIFFTRFLNLPGNSARQNPTDFQWLTLR